MLRSFLRLNIMVQSPMKTLYLVICSALLSFSALADVPSSSRSAAAIERTESNLRRDLELIDLELGTPIFIQITKIPGELTVFARTKRGNFKPFRTYPICAYSGGLGPKKKQGDHKSPEGFYKIKPSQMNPSSSFHLSFNLGYPNALDRSKGYTGDFLMVHGSCVSIGCYAMTDPVIEEIWTLMTAAFEAGQSEIDVHIFPYRMNWPMRIIPFNHPDYAFWRTLKPAWKAFSITERPPRTSAASGRYVVLPAID